MTAVMELLHPAPFLLFLLFLLTRPGVTSADNNGPVKVKVTEGDDVVLPCSLRQTDLRYQIFDWTKVEDDEDKTQNVFLYKAGIHYNNGLTDQDPQFKGRVSHFEDELQHGNASIKIRNTKLEDRGNYKCIFPNLQDQIFHIELVVGPVEVTEGYDVVLPCSLRQTDLTYKVFDWKKDDQKEVFLYDSGIHYNNGRGGQDQQFKDRVSHFEDELQRGNASIKIRDTKVEDSGNYSCIFPNLQDQIFRIELVVGASPKLYVTNRDQTADRALLECAVQRAFPKPTVQWKNRAGEVLSSDVTHESTTTSKDNKDIKLFDITLQTYVTQTGRYNCVVTQDKIHHQVLSTIFVRLGAALKPFVSRLDQKKDQALLQCEVHGASSKPVVQWRDSSGNVVPAKEPRVTERGGSYDIILQTTVTKTDSYRCVSTQDEIKHQVHAETYVSISGSQFPWWGWIILVIGVVIGGVIGGVIGRGIGGVIGGGILGFIGGGIVVAAPRIWAFLRKRSHGSARSNADSKVDDEDVPLPTNGSSDNRVVVKEGSDALHVL